MLPNVVIKKKAAGIRQPFKLFQLKFISFHLVGQLDQQVVPVEQHLGF
jgi:hypothetical protein